MNDSQIAFGKTRIARAAWVWGVDVETAARILRSYEHEHFFDWIHADEFLEKELWREK